MATVQSESKKKSNNKSNNKISAKTQNKLDIIKKHKLSKATLIDMYKNSYLSRKLDDAEISMKKQSKAFFQISGAGHEGILSAVTQVLKPKYDYFIPYYRDRALCTGLGVTPYEMLCQANGNIGDTASHGRQMPAHWGNVDLNIVSKSSCTGTQFLQAVGAAEAGLFLSKMSKDGVDHGLPYANDEIVYVSCGDGTTSQGEFWEGITTAAVNKLPVMFLVEDNGFAISVPTSVQTPGGSISKALKGMPGLTIYECDGTDPIDSYDTVKAAELHLRAGKGPVLVHAHVTRPYSHSLSDDHSFYRTKTELAEEAKLDVINTYPAFLIEGSIATQNEIDSIKAEIDTEVRKAMLEAIATEWPDPNSYMDHLYSMDIDPTSSDFEREGTFVGKNDIPMAGAINAVLKSELKKNPLMRMFGEDVADFSELEKLDNPELVGKGGVFKVTSGCQRESKEGQVFNSPLAEANIIGRAITMAMRGIKPVVEIQFFDYIWTAFMQLKNEMATMRYRSGGDFKCPMVIRVPSGGYLRGGAIYHSQSGESLFTHCPGIRVVYPSNAKDAAGLLRTAIRCDDPVIFMEHKHLYYQGYNRTSDPGEDFMIPFGKANVVREGTDATVVAWGALVQKSLEAARRLESEGYKIEVLDLRTIAPFDMDAIVKSLTKTNRIMIAHEEHTTSGFAGEIAARINEQCFNQLDAPILRVGSKDVHVAYNPAMEDLILPQIDDVYNKLKELLDY